MEPFVQAPDPMQTRRPRTDVLALISFLFSTIVPDPACRVRNIFKNRLLSASKLLQRAICLCTGHGCPEGGKRLLIWRFSDDTEETTSSPSPHEGPLGKQAGPVENQTRTCGPSVTTRYHQQQQFVSERPYRRSETSFHTEDRSFFACSFTAHLVNSDPFFAPHRGFIGRRRW